MLACYTTPARATAANHAFLYDFSVKEEGILIDPTRLFLGGEPGERYALTVTVITNTGVSYEAPLTVSIPAEENSEKPRLSRKKRSLPSPPEKETGFLWLWILLDVIIVGGAAAVLMVLTKRKKK